MDRYFCIFVLGCVLALLTCGTPARAVQLTQTKDSSLILYNTVYRAPLATGPEIGFWDGPVVSVYVFQLPSKAPGQSVVSASFQVQTWQDSYGGAITFNGDLYGLRANTSPTVALSDVYAGAFGGDPNAMGIEANLFTLSVSTAYAVPTTVTTNSTADALLTHL